MPSPVCTKCGSGHDVHKSWCRECRNQAGRDRYASDPEKARRIKRESMRRLRQNPETRARWNAAKSARWATHYAPRQKIRLAEWKQRHFFAWRARIVRRYGDSTITAQQLASLWRVQRGRCALTGRKLDRFAEIDHIVPRSRGGAHDLSNLRWVCKAANEAKRGLTDEEFVQLCTDVGEWIRRQLLASIEAVA